MEREEEVMDERRGRNKGKREKRGEEASALPFNMGHIIFSAQPRNNLVNSKLFFH